MVVIRGLVVGEVKVLFGEAEEGFDVVVVAVVVIGGLRRCSVAGCDPLIGRVLEDRALGHCVRLPRFGVPGVGIDPRLGDEVVARAVNLAPVPGG